VKVAIVDSFKDYQQAQARGELPVNITSYHPGYNGLAMGSEHGTACAEIIYDMAPGASLTFASSAGVTGLANVIVQLAQRGNKIISLSVGNQGFEPGDGTGIMHDAIRAAYQYGALVVQAAGNDREHHWDGRFGDANADHWHEFATGVDINWLDGDSSIAGVRPLQKNYGPFSINLRWNSWPTTTNDYDLYLFRYSDVTKKIEIVTSSTMRQTGTLPPNEFIDSYTVPEAGYYYGIGIQRWRATGAEVLSLSGHWLPPFAVNVPDRSLIDGATSPYALTVAAADVGTFNLESYSSLGPTYGRGGALTGGSGKPNIAAYANVSTWAYNRNGKRFNGTSSATPHVAGAAALVMEAYPQARAGDIWNHLMAFVVDRGPTGYDHQYGYGVLRMWDQPPSRGGGSQTPPGQSCPGCAPQVGYQLYLPSVVR
jgi:subtilisin family serine protease